MRLLEMTSAEAGEAADRGAVLVIAVGAVEQHGPALPLGTDTIRAEAVVRYIEDALPDDVVVGPTLPVGVSPHHLAFPGTMTLRPETFTTVLAEWVDSLATHGWRRFLVVTGHGGNNAALGTLAQRLLADAPHLELAWTPVTALATDAVAALDPSEVHGHSGEAETAQVLHVAPELVRRDLLAPGTTRLDELDDLGRLVRRPGHPTMTFRYDRLAASGVLGDPRRVSAADGQKILDLVRDRLVEFVEAWLRP